MPLVENDRIKFIYINIYTSGFQPVDLKSILQWTTEYFGLKKSYLLDELFIDLV